MSADASRGAGGGQGKPGDRLAVSRSRCIGIPFGYNGKPKEITTMSVTLDLPAELETELAAEAAQLGLPLAEYVLRLLASGRPPHSVPRSGAELVAYWQGERLIGTRPEIADSHAHARALRQQAEKRERA
jgi:hypothetical protein